MSRAFIWMYGCMMWFVGFVTSLLTYVKYMIDYAAFVNGSKMIVRSPIDDLDYKVTTALMLISLVFCIVFYHLYKRTTVHSE